MKNTILRILDLIKKGEINFVIKGVLKRMQSKTEVFGLKRDLSVEFKNPDALIDISIRPLKAKDYSHFAKDLQNAGLIEKDIPTCYVAVTNEDIPCYRQWLMGPKQNIKIREFWKQSFPVLKDDEALVESAFAIPAFRGNRIMPAAMARIAKKGQDLGVRYIITFVSIDNIPSLKGCHRSGFSPYILRTEKWFLFKRIITFNDISNELIQGYLKNIGQIK
jgi:hypothetical protein